jgi:hypothetical protein
MPTTKTKARSNAMTTDTDQTQELTDKINESITTLDRDRRGQAR